MNLPVVSDLGVIAFSLLTAVAADINLPVAPDLRGFLLPRPPLKNLFGPTPRPGNVDVEPIWNLGDLRNILSLSSFSGVPLNKA